jgi:RNase P/RNase MRP subunit p30
VLAGDSAVSHGANSHNECPPPMQLLALAANVGFAC